MSQDKPYKIFVSHEWEEDEDYLRVFEYLESSPNFFYTNVGNAAAARGVSNDADREALRAQVGQSEVVIALAAQYAKHASTLEFICVFAQASKRPVILLRSFGAKQILPRALTEYATEILDWDARSLVTAIKRHARGEGGKAWDVVEFTLD